MNRSNLIKQLALSAGDIILKSIPEDVLHMKEGENNFVTQADIQSERYIIEEIHKYFPEDVIMSEETHANIDAPLECDHLWVIDPLDGTTNFRFHRNYSSVSIGYVENGKLMAGCVYNPFSKELYFAEKGKGSFLNKNPLHVNTTNSMEKAAITTDPFYDSEKTRQNLQLILTLQPTPWTLIRGTGSLEMCEVAAGKTDLYFHTGLKPWDNAAAFLIAQEAGAIITNLQGEQTNFLTSEVVVGNGTLVREFLRQINP